MSARIYSVLLSLYPGELRESFGAEMTQVFLEDLEQSYSTGGIVGAARVWYRSFKELFRIALPARVAGREFAVPLIVYLVQEIYLGGIFLLSPREPRSPDVDFFAIWGLIPAFVAWVALRVGNRSLPIPLDLRSR